jgi:2'-5' RNA ligase
MRLVIVAFLDDVVLGARFAPGALPLHVTLVPPADTDAGPGQVEAVIEAALAAFGPFEVEGGDDELFGARNDVEVTLVVDDGTLARLHRELLLALRPLGVRVPRPDQIGAGFRPHVTVQDGERIERGERAELDAVALLVRDAGEWELVAQFPLI